MSATRNVRTPLGRVVGLGSAKDGVHHWWAQRVTAVALTFLTIWFVITVIGALGADHQSFGAAIGAPGPAIMMILFVVTGFHHLRLGLQVVIEDYVHGEAAKLGLIMAVTFACYGLAAACVFSVLKLALTA